MTDFRALCAELLDEIPYESPLTCMVRAALAEPQPPADGEVEENPWKDALLDALVCNFLLNEENASDPGKALRDLLAWEAKLARDPSINPPPQPIPVSERLPEAEDYDAEGRCWWLHIGEDGVCDWFQRAPYPSVTTYLFFRMTHWLPARALPLPSKEVE